MLRSNLSATIIKLVLALFTSVSLVFALTTTLGIEISFFELLGLIAVIMLFFGIVTLSKTSIVITLVVFLVGTASFTLYAAQKDLFKPMYDSVALFFTWFADYLSGFDIMTNKYGLIVALVLSFAISLPVFIFTVKRFNFYVILIGGTSLFIAQWIMDFFNSYTAFFIYMITLLTYYFIYIFEKSSRTVKNEYATFEKMAVWSVPVAVIVILASLMFPTSNRPIEWKWLDDKIFRIIDYFQYKAFPETFDYFTLSETGFGESSGRLGGKVNLDDTHVLTVNTPVKSYLRGSERSIYTGYSWVTDENEEQEIKRIFYFENEDEGFDFLDVKELAFGLSLLIEPSDYEEHFEDKESYIKTFFDKNVMEITFENIRTKSVFAPLKLTAVRFNENTRVPYLNATPNDILFAPERLRQGSRYNVNLMFTRYANVDFIDLLKRSHKDLYKDILDSYNSISAEPQDNGNDAANNGENASSDMENTHDSGYEIDIELARQFYENASRIYDKYLQLPISLPSRVSELAHAITDEYETRYDKVKSIESFLSTNYEYTLDPGPTPRNQDFVDYFLFEQRKGYCTFFASAMTVMLRTLGIPARYVEGYKLPEEPITNDANIYIVTNRQAHAWVEVYFEGFGWIPFEPTAPYVFSFYRDHYSRSFVIPSSSLDYLYQDEYYYEIFDTKNFEYFDPLETDSAGSFDYYTVIIAITITLVVLVFLMILVNGLRTTIRFYKFRKMPPRESVLNAFQYYFRVLALQGFAFKAGETPLEYAERLKAIFIYPEKYPEGKSGKEAEETDKELPEGQAYMSEDQAYTYGDQLYMNEDKMYGPESKSYYPENLTFENRIIFSSKGVTKSGFQQLMDVFVKARYSNHEVLEDDKKYVFGYRPHLLRDTRMNIGFIRYLILRFIAGKI